MLALLRRRWPSTRPDAPSLSSPSPVQSQTTEDFRALLAAAPAEIRAKARSAYQVWSENPTHPSLRFKRVHGSQPIYSVRITLDWRALCILKGDVAIWFWIGPHSEYERILSKV